MDVEAPLKQQSVPHREEWTRSVFILAQNSCRAPEELTPLHAEGGGRHALAPKPFDFAARPQRNSLDYGGTARQAVHVRCGWGRGRAAKRREATREARAALGLRGTGEGTLKSNEDVTIQPFHS
eukprot:scaffold2888_cov274-Pinguiococcus_pyrenoidosus.AAC.4